VGSSKIKSNAQIAIRTHLSYARTRRREWKRHRSENRNKASESGAEFHYTHSGAKRLFGYFQWGDKIIVKCSLRNVKELFPAGHFVRVHKSFLVSAVHLKTQQVNNIVTSSFEIPIGRAYKQQVEIFFSRESFN
jgi:hypothetical protein